MRWSVTKRLIVSLAGLIATATPVSGQDLSYTSSGRAARVWATSSSVPITGSIDVADATRIRLRVEDPFCGPGGCNRSFSIAWPDVARLQVGRLSSTDRAIRAAAVGVGLAFIVGGGMRSCEGPDSRRCEGLVAVSAGAVGFAGYFFARQSWVDVPLRQ